ncbi:hypothetical protein ACH33_14545 [Aneurinibacillus sp. XH2]|uniref:hypothetical protein n=1 Tax=Aneurinibacillus thermoaerophilus TaxID=143495 RepID=UPI00070A72BD|nr:hypothetical protein [Aneurinibacillus thermoaerophilus]AMA73937.1 hypothetical protein ACH33_14545 [Aneurinibacillus sp. XH2]
MREKRNTKRKTEERVLLMPEERELALILQELRGKVEQAQEERRLDYEMYDECRQLLFRLDLLVPYSGIMPPALQERIANLIMEDTPRLLYPYLALGEESMRSVRREAVAGIRFMAAEAKRIVGAIQEYERQGLASQAAFISSWYKKK